MLHFPQHRRRSRTGLIALALVALIVLDRAGTRPAIFAIDEYRAHISPHLRGIVVCRFTPSCSAYGRESIRKHGLIVGGAKAAWRIARCGPWTKMGTIDLP
jgi:putative component of membrane protein insertase Oxa1/YidC/SpoIIIJ protein YidD